MKTNRNRVTHELLTMAAVRLPTDYYDFGGAVQRWRDPEGEYPDCSMGCRWAAWLEPPFGADWLVCTNPNGPRKGLLTFEHQAGEGCFSV